MAHPVTWFQIQGNDSKKLTSFYKKIFGWRMQESPQQNYSMVAKEADGIPGGIGASMDGNPSVTVYVNVDDLGAHLKKIEAAGGKTAMPPMDLPDGMGKIAGFIDPVGNWVGLWAPGKAAAQLTKKARAKKAPAKRAAKAAPAKAKGKAKAKAKAKRAAKPAKKASRKRR